MCSLGFLPLSYMPPQMKTLYSQQVINQRIVVLQSHRMLWIGGDLTRSYNPTFTMQWENHLLQNAGHSFEVPQDMVGFLSCKCTLLNHVHFSNTSVSKSFSSVLLSQYIHLPVLILGIVPTLPMVLLNSMRFPQAHSSSLPRSLWMESAPSGMSTAPFILCNLQTC